MGSDRKLQDAIQEPEAAWQARALKAEAECEHLGEIMRKIGADQLMANAALIAIAEHPGWEHDISAEDAAAELQAIARAALPQDKGE